MHATGTPDWAIGLNDAPAAPTPGDVWSLSWDGVHEGVVVIAQVHPDFVLGIPVTAGEASATEVVSSINETNIVLWPQAETGLGTFLLHHRIGPVLDASQVREVRRWAAEEGELTTVSAGSGAVDMDTLADLLKDFRRRCFIEWPSDSEVTIDVPATGLNARQFHEVTGLAADRVLDLWGGHTLTEDEVAVLGDRADTWTTYVADGPTRELASPDVKVLVLELCDAAGLSERDARNSARNAYALAARTNSVSECSASRAADTLRLLIRDAHAS